MNWNFPTERKAKLDSLLQRVESVRETVMANAAESERIGTLPKPSVDALYEAGLFALKFPECLGGAEADPVAQIRVIEAMARYDTSAAWCMMIGATSAARPATHLTDASLDTFMPNGRVPLSASVGSSGIGKAVQVDGGYVFTGRWRFASGIRHSEWITCGATVQNESDEEPRLRSAIFPTAEVTIHDNWDVSGLRGTGSCDFSLTDQFVPDELTWDIAGSPKRGGALYKVGSPGFVIHEHAGIALGIGQRSLDAITEVAKYRGRWRKSSTISQRGHFQRILGELEIKLSAARSYTYQLFEKAWQEVCSNDDLTPETHARLRACATFDTDVAIYVATQAFRFAGGSAIYATSELQQCLRDITAAGQHFMVSDSSYENHAQFILDMPEANPMG